MRKTALATLVAAVALAGPALAQDAGPADEAAMMAAWAAAMTPGPEHEGLADLAGTWDVTTTFLMTPDGEPAVSQATADRSMIFGGRVLEEQFSGAMGGLPFQGRATTGYDNVTGRYWGTWIDTVSTGITVLQGGYDETGLWVMEGETPDAMTGTLVPMRIESRRDGPDRHVDTFFMPGPDGELVPMMEMVYERR